jgi:hypothetical protein
MFFKKIWQLWKKARDDEPWVGFCLLAHFWIIIQEYQTIDKAFFQVSLDIFKMKMDLLV